MSKKSPSNVEGVNGEMSQAESKSGMQHYDKVRKLGQGSFGSVFLMKDRRDDAQCVMKAIDLDQLDAKGKQEALREVGFLATLKHPAIIAYRDYFQVQEPALGWRKAQNMLHIIMEFADGGDLSGRIRSQENVMFPEQQVMMWLVQVCLALKHMHDRNVIHRDIKSENVFLTSTNIVKLGDFGISKHLASTLANAHTRIGTPYYLSPEICMDKPYNTKTDMWALGVVLYEMLMLCHPFDAASMEQLLAKICRGRHAAVSRRWNPHLRAIVDKLLSKDPNQRPSVEELLKNQLLQPYIKKFLDTLEAPVAARVYESLMYVHKSKKENEKPTRGANNSNTNTNARYQPSQSISSVSSQSHLGVGNTVPQSPRGGNSNAPSSQHNNAAPSSNNNNSPWYDKNKDGKRVRKSYQKQPDHRRPWVGGQVPRNHAAAARAGNEILGRIHSPPRNPGYGVNNNARPRSKHWNRNNNAGLQANGLAAAPRHGGPGSVPRSVHRDQPGSVRARPAKQPWFSGRRW